ncbi:MAG: hypothetical protein K1W08_02930 [Lachnospiraceae bacterium]
MKTIYRILAALAIAGVLLAVVVLTARGAKGEEAVMTSTETAPIYNHFPDLPETTQIKWCSKSSGGIGLVTTKLYIYAFYDADLGSQLQDMDFESEAAPIESAYESDEVKGQKWRHAANAPFAFQTGIKDMKRMYTEVYLSESGRILYIEAIGD